MIDTTKPVQLRNGQEARILCDDLIGPNSEKHIVVACKTRSGSEYVRQYYPNGKWFQGEKDPNELDLINAVAVQGEQP